jgi:hypothetical protein
MRSPVRPMLSVARNSLLRNLSSLAPGYILLGTHWNYRVLDAIKGDSTHISAVFKAEVIPREIVPNTPQ